MAADVIVDKLVNLADEQPFDEGFFSFSFFLFFCFFVCLFVCSFIFLFFLLFSSLLEVLVTRNIFKEPCFLFFHYLRFAPMKPLCKIPMLAKLSGRS